MTIEVREHRPGHDVKTFLKAAEVVFRGDPQYVSLFPIIKKDDLDPKKNPFFEDGEAALFTAWKDGQLVGRCSASIDYAHQRLHGDDIGFFGFFDTIDDQDVADALMAKAEAWLRSRDIKRMIGPLSLNIKEEVGLLIEGFDYPPMPMMGHSRPYQARLVENAGFEKLKDFYAWRYENGKIPKRATRAWEAITALPEVTLRPVRMDRLEEEIATIVDIFNDAWSDNWGFVPATASEARKMATDLKLILRPEIAFIAEIKGRAMGMCVAIPNIHEAMMGLDNPITGLPRFLWRLKVSGVKSARLLLLGLRKELRGVKRYGGLSMAMYVEVSKNSEKLNIEWGELGWTLEDNHPVNLGIKAMGARKYKTYRVYEKRLDGESMEQST